MESTSSELPEWDTPESPPRGPLGTTSILADLVGESSWADWGERLTARKEPESLAKRMPGAGSDPLLWSLTTLRPADRPDSTLDLLARLNALRWRRHRDEDADEWNEWASEWIDSLEKRHRSPDLALECLAWGYALPRLVMRLRIDRWSALLTSLLDTIADATTTQLDQASVREIGLAQLLAGELPLALAYGFPKSNLSRQQTSLGRRTISESMVELLDGEGILRADCAHDWRRLLACWTRCMFLDTTLRGGGISKEARQQYEWMVRQSLRWRRGDGTLAFEPEGASADSLDTLLKAAIQVGGDPVDRELYSVVSGRKKASSGTHHLPQPGEHSEWAELALLRSDWTSRSAHLAVTFARGKFVGELTVGGTRIWCGEAMPQIHADGVALDYVAEWEEVCWSSDADADYLELEIELSDGWRLQRQILMTRRDHILFAADALVGTRRAALEYQLTLPMDAAIHFTPQREHTEINIAARKPLGCLMPLALSEWRSERHNGRFDGLTLHQADSGESLYAPLFYDLDPRRRRKPRTWRHLTVAQDLKIVPREVAVAYRVQVGSDQWIVYRSLGPVGNRTFIGHNLTSEFLVARFSADGDVENLIEIE